MHRRSLIADLAEALSKSEDEVRQFLEALWQWLPLAIEVEPPFVRYLDAKIEGVRSTLEAEIKGLRSAFEAEINGLRSTLEAEINGLRMAMEQGFKRAEERDEALRREMEQGFLQARERDEALKRLMEDSLESVRKELRQEIDSLRQEVKRLERWFLGFSIPMLLMLIGLTIQNFLK